MQGSHLRGKIESRVLTRNKIWGRVESSCLGEEEIRVTVTTGEASLEETWHHQGHRGHLFITTLSFGASEHRCGTESQVLTTRERGREAASTVEAKSVTSGIRRGGH